MVVLERSGLRLIYLESARARLEIYSPEVPTKKSSRAVYIAALFVRWTYLERLRFQFETSVQISHESFVTSRVRREK
jgi:hypothetical protein